MLSKAPYRRARMFHSIPFLSAKNSTTTPRSLLDIAAKPTSRRSNALPNNPPLIHLLRPYALRHHAQSILDRILGRFRKPALTLAANPTYTSDLIASRGQTNVLFFQNLNQPRLRQVASLNGSLEIRHEFRCDLTLGRFVGLGWCSTGGGGGDEVAV